MSEQNLFEAIRNEDVVLWIGSGLSLYAGYPSTESLNSKFMGLLSETVQRDLMGKDLKTVTQTVQDSSNSGRKDIIQILNDEFVLKQPKTIEYHLKLAKIAHFSTIITTNYDRVLEIAFGDKAQAIINDQHLYHGDLKKVQILKIHGDTTDSNSVIISESDYVHFFSNANQKNIWSVVSEKIATKTQLFIGYNLNDININSIFHKIWANVDFNHKRCYLVSPALPAYKITSLEKMNIEYIDSTGELFIDRLYDNITSNIIGDFNKGKVNPETFRKVLHANNLTANLSGVEDKFILKSVEGINGRIVGHMTLKFNSDEKVIKGFKNFVLGDSFEDFVIPSTSLNGIEIKAGDISLLKESDLSLLFKRVPALETIFDIRFDSFDFEMLDLPIKIFSSEKMIEAHINLNQGDLKLSQQLPFSTELPLQFTTQHKPQFGRTLDEITFFKFISALFSGKEFIIFPKNESPIPYSISRHNEIVMNAEMYLTYFKKLSEIEKYYKIKFHNYDFHTVNQESEESVNIILEAIHETTSERHFTGILKATINDWDANQIKQLSQLKNHPSGITIHNTVKTIVNLHGIQIELGYKKIQFPKLKLLNKKALLKRRRSAAEFTNDDKHYFISYTKEAPQGDISPVKVLLREL